MTIHHDKLAYGKLAPQSEELPEEKLAAMLKALSEEEDNEDTEEKNGEKKGERKA